jgi:hypothetical protein
MDRVSPRKICVRYGRKLDRLAPLGRFRCGRHFGFVSRYYLQQKSPLSIFLSSLSRVPRIPGISRLPWISRVSWVCGVLSITARCVRRLATGNGRLTSLALCSLPSNPSNSTLVSSYSILERASDSAEALFQAFETVRSVRGATGTPTDHEQDLLRAAFVFASAGLDSMVKQLVRDTLHLAITKDMGARAQFAAYVQSRLRRADQIDFRFLAETLAAPTIATYLESEPIKDLTRGSLQSKDELLRVAAYFAIGADEVTKDPKHLQTVFSARNEIVHEMDILFGQTNRGRRQRKRSTMRNYTTVVLSAAVCFYSAVEKRL